MNNVFIRTNLQKASVNHKNSVLQDAQQKDLVSISQHGKPDNIGIAATRNVQKVCEFRHEQLADKVISCSICQKAYDTNYAKQSSQQEPWLCQSRKPNSAHCLYTASKQSVEIQPHIAPNQVIETPNALVTAKFNLARLCDVHFECLSRRHVVLQCLTMSLPFAIVIFLAGVFGVGSLVMNAIAKCFANASHFLKRFRINCP
ncbi:hypothetical protein GQX74_004913 [Glossina fuscipes]|nr:hypothetical protein GQX74_004913 [Glossina fuscipes]